MTNIIHSKVKKIYEDSLDLISSPSVKIQIMGGKDVCKGKTLVGVAQQCFAFTPQANFPEFEFSLK